MPVFARVIMGCLAIFIAWTMVRAARSGTVFDENRTYVENDQPAAFVFVMIGQFFCLLFCVWLVAGYSAEEFAGQLGLGDLLAKLK